MKKLLVMILSLVFILGMSTDVKAEGEQSIEDMLAPYQAAVDKLNDEMGSNIYIPEKNKEKVYENIKDKTPEEVALMLKEEYTDYVADEAIKSQPETDEYITDGIHSETKKDTEIIISPYYVRETLMQTVPIVYNSELYLSSTIYSLTDTDYIYERINDYGTRWLHDYTGYHFAVDTRSYSLSADKKSCTVYLTGHPEDAQGFALGLYLSTNHTFTA